MSETGPSFAQIVAEWIITDPVGDSALWREGMCRYEAGSLDDGAAMGEAAELMCAALTHYVADGTAIGDIGGESPDTALEQTIWNVLVATLYGGGGKPLSAGSAKCLRLALAGVRRGGFQAEDLGGNGLMAEVFDDGSRALMTAALSGLPAPEGEAPVQLTRWFTSQAASKPRAATRSSGTTQHGAALPGEGVASAGSRWGALRKRAQDAREHVNPLVLQHGIEAIQGALTEAQVAKMDKAGKLKIRKFGVAKAAVRPSRTLRRAIDGAALTEHLKAYNQQVSAKAAAGEGPESAMPKMTPAQEAAYAIDYNLAREDLSPAVQLEYDRLIKERAQARTGVSSKSQEHSKTDDIQPGGEGQTMASAAGWYADPAGKAELRYWDGSAWTHRTKNRADEDESSAPMAIQKPTAKPKSLRQRSEICVIDWIWADTTATDRRTRKDFPFEIWFVANALGPNGLYQAGESSRTFYAPTTAYHRWGPVPRYSNGLPKHEHSEASFNDLVKQLWEAGWEPTSGSGKGALWWEYRFRRAVAE